MSEKNPVVSICCITYNHAPFIRKALDGFLMQDPPSYMPKDAKLSDWCEILIHDDCSTDGTTEIIREYAAKYPDVIFPLYEEVNQYSIDDRDIDLYNYNRARGKYIAYCEGDDYWTDSNKLQKQIAFMDTHLEYSVCFHCYKNFIVNKNEYITETPPVKLLRSNNNSEGVDIDISRYFDGWYTQPLTMLFRVSMCNFSIRKAYRHFRDMHEIYYLLRAGKCRLLNFDGSVRNVHDGGVISMISKLHYCELSLPIDREFYWKTLDEGPKKNYLSTLDACVRVYSNGRKWKAFRCAIIRYIISRRPKTFIRHLKIIFGKG